MNMTRENLLAHVEKSPGSLANDDKTAWLNIFSDYSIVEDPVGSQPHFSGVYDKRGACRGNGPLSRFYDTFIAPNDITFDVKNNFICGQHVVRDLTVTIAMSDKVKTQVAMHLLYEIREEQGELKIGRLAAHWELIPMVTQLLAQGIQAIPVLTALSIRMLRYQGIGGMIGFMKGLRLIGKTGKEVVAQFETAINENKQVNLSNLFDSACEAVSSPYGSAPVPVCELLQKLPGNIKFGKTLLSGYTVSCSFDYIGTEEQGRNFSGVALFEFNHKTQKIDDLRFYYE